MPLPSFFYQIMQLTWTLVAAGPKNGKVSLGRFKVSKCLDLVLRDLPFLVPSAGAMPLYSQSGSVKGILFCPYETLA